MQNSRTQNVAKNAIFALVCQVLNLIISFGLRTVFISTLGADYLGVNGLFSNILSILSFAELGIGNAIVFNMYKPLAEGDTDKVNSLMQLYRRAYDVIALFVAAVGIFIIPFLDKLITGEPSVNEDITLLYVLFLANTVCSYLFVYKKSLITADQRDYIVLLTTQAVHIFQTVVQIIILYTTKDYILYLSVQIGCTLFGNVLASIIANRLYPYLTRPAVKLSKVETRNIFANVKDLTLYKFGSVILNSTDNILVSSLVGITEVGLVSNYTLITSACNSILGNITSAFIASVGNLNVAESAIKKYDVFKKMLFITSWIYGFASVGLLAVLKSFIPTWIGETYVLDKVTVIAIVAEFYVQGVHSVESTFRTTLGYFRDGRFSAFLSAVLNLVLSVVLCKIIGLAGIFIATPISRALGIGIVDTYLIYKKALKRKPIEYYLSYAGYLLIFLAILFICNIAISYVSHDGWIGVICQAIVVTVLFNGLMILMFCRTRLFREIWHSAKHVLIQWKKKIKL